MRPEINRYFRAMLLEGQNSQQEAIIQRLNTLYLTSLENNSVVARRVHAIYYIARSNSPQREEIIKKAFNIETNMSVLLSLYFGAIKLGKLDKEQEFYDKLLNNQEYDEANRGYHVTYYLDVIMGTTWPFHDDVHVKWEGTLQAFMRHFRSNKKEHYFLRRIDLTTMMQLIQARRNVAPLTIELLDELESLVYTPILVDYPDFQKKIISAYSDLKIVFEDIFNHTS